MTDSDEHTLTVTDALRRLEPSLPGSVRYRLENSLDHIERASRLFDIDREMASFRAITGEEEASTALIKAIQLRGYEHAREFNPRNHVHKAAVMACVDAVTTSMIPILGEFQLIFNFDRSRIDVKIPLSAFGVDGDFAIQPVEPLGFVHSRPGIKERNLYDDVLYGLAEKASFDGIKKMVFAVANARNGLLYASDSALPRSQATREAIRSRERRALTMLVLSVMVLQTRDHLPTVREATLAFLSIISRLPEDDGT